MTGLNTSFRSATPSNEGDFDDYWHPHHLTVTDQPIAMHVTTAIRQIHQGDSTRRQELGHHQTTVPIVFSLFLACGWMNRNEECQRHERGLMHTYLYLITDVIWHDIDSISCCWWQFHFCPDLSPVSVRLTLLYIEKKVFSAEQAISWSRFCEMQCMWYKIYSCAFCKITSCNFNGLRRKRCYGFNIHWSSAICQRWLPTWRDPDTWLRCYCSLSLISSFL